MMRATRADDWETRELPRARTTLALDRTFSAQEMARIQLGFRPQEMEDKWFIYWAEETLHFHRSWTGFCIYEVRFGPCGTGARMVSAQVNRDPEQYGETSDEHDRDLVSYLIDVLLLREEAEYPEEAADPLALWGMMGRTIMGQYPDDDEEG